MSVAHGGLCVWLMVGKETTRAKTRASKKGQGIMSDQLTVDTNHTGQRGGSSLPHRWHAVLQTVTEQWQQLTQPRLALRGKGRDKVTAGQTGS